MIIYNDIEAFLSLDPTRFRYLASIGFTRHFILLEEDESESNRNELKIILREFNDNEVRDLKLKFVNVLDIKIGNINNELCLSLNIKDIKDHQLEGVSYQVTEEKHNTFSFYCSDFFVESHLFS